MQSIQLQTGAQYWRGLAVLWALFGFMGLTMIIFARTTTEGLLGVFFALVPSYMLIARHIWWVARMDRDGVMLVSGRRFAWADLVKVVDVRGVHYAIPIQNAASLNYTSSAHNHYELVFKHGRARVFDRMLKNPDEAVAALDALERGEHPFAATPPAGSSV